MAKTSKGTKICVVKSSAAGTSITPTGATTAKPVEITAANTLKVGDLVTLAADSTGLSEVDGKTWVVGTASATKFTLLGSDAAASTGSFAAGTAITGYSETDLECICLSSIGFNQDTPQPISVATFCDTTASIPGNPGSSSIDFAGYADISGTDYAFMLDLAATNDMAHWRIMMPNNGYIVFDGTVDSINWGVPIEGAYTYSGTATLASAPRHLF